MNAQTATTLPEPRDFTFIKPSGRRLTEYEALTVHMQPDALDFDRPRGNLDVDEWYLLRSDGSGLWRRESTQLRHSDWFAFRDPAQQWQRTYVRQQEQQESSIARVTEDAGLDGSLAQLERPWIDGLLCTHYRAWSFFEYAIFRALAPAQREALADTIGNLLCFQGVDHLRHAQAVILYLVELENYVQPVPDALGKDAWLHAPAYQPARRLAEQIIATDDWAELLIGLNLVVAPMLQQMAASDLVRRNALVNGDAVAAHIVLTAERDRRRNLAATQAFVQMVTTADVPDAAHNRQVIQSWLDQWTQAAVNAAQALTPVYTSMPVAALDYPTSFAAAAASCATIVHGLGFTSTFSTTP